MSWRPPGVTDPLSPAREADSSARFTSSEKATGLAVVTEPLSPLQERMIRRGGVGRPTLSPLRTRTRPVRPAAPLGQARAGETSKPKSTVGSIACPLFLSSPRFATYPVY